LTAAAARLYDRGAMQPLSCPACNRSLDPTDNFCRDCGTSIQPALPAVRQSSLPVVWQPNMAPVVRGAAVMAAGAIGQFALRRMVGGVFRRPVRTRAMQKLRNNDGLTDEAQIITEMVMMRRIRLRRPD
jgi:hypothetical protein